MVAADDAAKRVPVDKPLPQGEDQHRARLLMSRAVACIEEVLKWITEGMDRVPEAAFFTAQGQEMHAREPGRFRRERLQAVLSVYREVLLRLS